MRFGSSTGSASTFATKGVELEGRDKVIQVAKRAGEMWKVIGDDETYGEIEYSDGIMSIIVDTGVLISGKSGSTPNIQIDGKSGKVVS